MQNSKFNKSTKNNAKRPEHERLHILCVPTCSKIPTTSLHLLLFLMYSQFATPLCFPQCCPSHLLFKYFRVFCSPFTTRHQAQQVKKQITSGYCILSRSSGYCWRLALTLRDRTRQVSAIQADRSRLGCFALLGGYVTCVGSCVSTFQIGISVPTSRVLSDCLHSYQNALHNIPDQRSLIRNCDGGLKSWTASGLIPKFQSTIEQLSFRNSILYLVF